MGGALALAAALGLIGPTAGAEPAAAGGFDVLYPLQDRYEPGQTAVLVGYTSRFLTGDPDTIDWSDTGPFFGYLRGPPPDPADEPVESPGGWRMADGQGLPLGQVIAEDPGNWWDATRVSLSFVLPATLQPGRYHVLVCTRPCTMTLGYIGESPLYVGVDPPRPIVRYWPADDPAIDALPEDALVSTSDQVAPVTAGRLRSGQILPPSPPATLPDRPPMTVGPPVRPSGSSGAADVATGPAAAADRDDGDGGGGGVTAWIVILALLAGVFWAVKRRGAARKQVHQATPAAAPVPPRLLPSRTGRRIHL